ncbi:MAG: HEPN domain-containing protein [Anaerolineae bacterium]
MNNLDLWQAWLAEAQAILNEARERYGEKRYHRVVRLCQEAVELAQKSLLMYCGVDVPREHDLSSVVDKLDLVQEKLKLQKRRELRRRSHRLARKRLVSFYGAEDGTPASALFSPGDADQALTDAESVIAAVRELTE